MSARGWSWAEGLEAFLRHARGARLAEATRKSRRRILTWCLQRFRERGWKRPKELTGERLRAFQTFLREKPSENGSGRLKPGTRRLYLQTLRLFLLFLRQRGHYALDAREWIRAPRRRPLPGACLTVQEAASLMNVPDLRTPMGARDRALLELFYATGLRRGELIRLQVSDLDLEGGMVTVRDGKGGRDRVVPMGGEALKRVKRYAREARKCFTFGPDSGRLFLTQRCGPFTHASVAYTIRKIVRKAGLKKNVTPHTFRRSLATGLLREKASTRHIQELLGHRSLVTTQVYTRTLPEELREVLQRTHPRERGRRS